MWFRFSSGCFPLRDLHSCLSPIRISRNLELNCVAVTFLVVIDQVKMQSPEVWLKITIFF